MEEAQKDLDALYARWAELEEKAGSCRAANCDLTLGSHLLPLLGPMMGKHKRWCSRRQENCQAVLSRLRPLTFYEGSE